MQYFLPLLSVGLRTFFSTFLHAQPFVFDNISMTSLVLKNQLLPVLLFNI